MYFIENYDSWQRILKNDAYSTSYIIFDELPTSAPKFRFKLNRDHRKRTKLSRVMSF